MCNHFLFHYLTLYATAHTLSENCHPPTAVSRSL